jgi:hypothetical protein
VCGSGGKRNIHAGSGTETPFKVGSGAEKNHSGYTTLLTRKEPEQTMESGMTLKGSDADSEWI